MPSIAPITGKLRNRVIQDISIALGGGTILAYGFWYGVHIKRVEKRTWDPAPS